MGTVDGIAELHMAGTRATFTLERGAEIDRDALAKEFAKRRMNLESIETVERPRAKVVYRVGAGLG